MHLTALSGYQDLGGCWGIMACCFSIALRRGTSGLYPRLPGQEQQQEPAREQWKHLLDRPKERFICRKGAGGAYDGAEAAVHFHMPPPHTGLPEDTWSHPCK